MECFSLDYWPKSLCRSIDIIHILDQDKKFHINSFEISIGRTTEVQEFITAFINRENLTETITLFR